mmetsp:Transcript_10779/g.12424  ORF Transcript_10779/g.12424 Transcript_10779/m.12424 type:complete len:436 (+) Transcript_10779:82-1389(+)
MNGASSTLLLDRPVKATANDAMVAKLATTHAGYYVDPFLDAMTRNSNTNPVLTASRERPMAHTNTGRRRTIQPIIKRGTHARVCVMDKAISTFLTTTQTKTQIVVLGAGFDTSFFRYRNGNIMGMEEVGGMKISSEEETDLTQQQQQQQHLHVDQAHDKQVHWYEVDHTSVIQEKATLIRKSNLLSSYCPQLIKTKGGFECNSNSIGISDGCCDKIKSSSSYNLVSHDLRNSPTKLLEKLKLDPTLPTLYIMECVSMYLPIMASKKLLRAISSSVDTTFIACYEPILDSNNNSSDPFGRVMEKNLVNIGVASPESCLLQTRTLRNQLEKLIECCFVRVVGCDMWSAYETIVTDAQRKRANQSEFLDEYEEWVLIMQHYCFFVARGGKFPCKDHNQNHMNNPEKIDLTTIMGHKEGKYPFLGWMMGKCLELEKSKE